MNSALISHAPHPSPVLPKGLADLRTFAASRETLVIDTLFSPRPFAPLSKSFRICTVTNSHQNPPLSNSFIFNHFQTFCKAPLSKSFRIKWLSKTGVGVGRTFNLRVSTFNIFAKYLSFLSLTKNDQFPSKTPQCFQSLTDQPSRTLQKSPNVFYHLQTTFPVTTCFFYHLRKKSGGRGWPFYKSSSVAEAFSHFGTAESVPLFPCFLGSLLPATLSLSLLASLLPSSLLRLFHALHFTPVTQRNRHDHDAQT
jgi:hypothetical protein